MPCLDPRRKPNPKYQLGSPTYVGPAPDPRLKVITFDCGKCVECLRKRASQWRFRLHQEFRYGNTDMKFITLTFSDRALDHLRDEWYRLHGYYGSENDLCTLAVRRFVERYRARYGKSLRHFLITEKGTDHDRIHLHGMICGAKCTFVKRGKIYIDKPKLQSIWSYGNIWLGWCNSASISYICKYLTKHDPNHPDFRGKLFVSPGFGASYVLHNSLWHHSVEGGIFYCLTSDRVPVSMPRYYKQKIFSEDEILAHSLALLDDPPPVVFRGKTYTSMSSYLSALRCYHGKMISLGLHFSALKFDPISPNLEFDF